MDVARRRPWRVPFRFFVMLALLWLAAPASGATGRTCRGDCDFDGGITVDELVIGVRLVLSSATSGCESLDRDGDGQVSVDEVVAAVGYALEGCPSVCSSIRLGSRHAELPVEGGEGCVTVDAAPSCCWTAEPISFDHAEPIRSLSPSHGCGAAAVCFILPPVPQGEYSWLSTARIAGAGIIVHQGEPLPTCTAAPCAADEVSLPGCNCRTPTPTWTPTGEGIKPSSTPTASVSPAPLEMSITSTPASSTTTLSPTPTDPATPAESGFMIRGCVVHFQGCGGSLEFGRVHLMPLNRTAQVDWGYFSFENVPPGEYTLTYSPDCNPAGCTQPKHAVIVDRDIYVGFSRWPEPTPVY